MEEINEDDIFVFHARTGNKVMLMKISFCQVSRDFKMEKM